MKRIAVLTSGGDAPGMNAAIRAVTRVALDHHWTVVGVERGFAGLMTGSFRPLGPRSVGGIVHLGGTMLGTARAPEFQTEAGRRQAIAAIESAGIDGLVVIGGNGSQAGSFALHELGVPVVGVASTIDNDLPGSDPTIGVDTALNIAIEAIDRLRVTAASHRRVFLVETMGRDCGYLALIAGIAGGAEAIVIPEAPTNPQALAQELAEVYERGKSHGIVVVAEGARPNADTLAELLAKEEDPYGFELRVTKLGHVQRGGVPTVADRLLGTRLGAAAVEQLARGSAGVLVGEQSGTVVTTPLAEVVRGTRSLDESLLRLAGILSR